MASKRNMVVVSDYGESIATLNLDDANSVHAWLTQVDSEAIALYDARCRLVRSQWNEYVGEVRQHAEKLKSAT